MKTNKIDMENLTLKQQQKIEELINAGFDLSECKTFEDAIDLYLEWLND